MNHAITAPLLGQEWVALQDNFVQYERAALTVKLLAVGLTALGLLMNLEGDWLCGLLAVLWLQEGIWRTSQARVGQRILNVEALLATPADALQSINAAPFQLHTEWLATRASGFGLLREYAANALRPTVAFPYAVLIAGVVLTALMLGAD